MTTNLKDMDLIYEKLSPEAKQNIKSTVLDLINKLDPNKVNFVKVQQSLSHLKTVEAELYNTKTNGVIKYRNRVSGIIEEYTALAQPGKYRLCLIHPDGVRQYCGVKFISNSFMEELSDNYEFVLS